MKNWSKAEGIGLIYPEISVSLHIEGKTKPIRDYGYVIAVGEGGIIAAFENDVTSQVIDGSKTFKLAKRWEDLKGDLQSLVERTPIGKHNELWIDTKYAEIIGVYVVEGTTAPGYKSFLKAAAHLPKKLFV